ncbi:hypothetical protein V5F77_12265 [Xanthobacter sp. DSM 24535]|uniref:hypothetical protein n=1 Tax=Roseixanthobacter psychrophilus TaxID=3119917 RepID=UPI003728D346
MTAEEAPLRNVDFSSWESLLVTLIGLALVTLIGVGIRLVIMFTVQQRRERMNRQINERLRTLIAAYKTLGGSFTGDLTVDPTHLRELRRRDDPVAESDALGILDTPVGSDRARRVRDAVEAALSDVILLGTDEQVRLAARAVRELVAGRPVQTHELVISLRDFVRAALDLAPVPGDLDLPMQGPTRPSGSGAKGKSERGADEARRGGGDKGSGGGMAGGGMAGGGGVGIGIGIGGQGGSLARPENRLPPDDDEN